VKAWLRGGHKAHKLLVIWGAHGVGKTYVTPQLAEHYGFCVRVATVDEQLNAAVVQLDCESMRGAVGKPNLLVYDDAHEMSRDAIGMLCEKFKSREMPPTIVIVDDYWEPIPHPIRQLHDVVGATSPHCVQLEPIHPAHLLMFFGHQMDSNMRGIANEVNGDVRQFTLRHMEQTASSAKRPRTNNDRTRLLSGLNIDLLNPSAAPSWDDRASAMMEDPDMSLMMLHENAPWDRDDSDMDEVAGSLETLSAMSTLTHQQSDFQMTEPAIAVCANAIHRGRPPAKFAESLRCIKGMNKRKREANHLSNEDRRWILEDGIRPVPFPDTDKDVDPEGETEVGRYKWSRR